MEVLQNHPYETLEALVAEIDPIDSFATPFDRIDWSRARNDPFRLGDWYGPYYFAIVSEKPRGKKHMIFSWKHDPLVSAPHTEAGILERLFLKEGWQEVYIWGQGFMNLSRDLSPKLSVVSEEVLLFVPPIDIRFASIRPFLWEILRVLTEGLEEAIDIAVEGPGAFLLEAGDDAQPYQYPQTRDQFITELQESYIIKRID